MEENQRSEAKQVTISVCMIVKDEESLLPRCLASIEAYADEIIVVDTGSKDTTVEIARSYGAKVYEHPWENDFSKHRNQSISYATGEWIFVIDADEELVPGCEKILKKAVADKEIDSIAVQIINPFNQGMNCGIFNSIRFFRRAAGVRYEGIVHNKEKGCRQTKFYPIRILHHGYNLNEQKMTSKFERTTALLKTKVEKDPQNPLLHHYLSASYLNMANFRKKYLKTALAESLKAIELANERGDDDPVFLWTHYIAATSYLNLEMDGQAKAVCGEALRLFPEHLDSHYILAKTYDRKGYHEKAKYHADCYFRIRNEIDKNPHRFGNIVINTYWNEWIIEIIRNKAIYGLGSPEEARKKFLALSEREPDNHEVQRLIGIFCFEKKAYKDAVRFLDKATRLKKDRVLLFMLVECYGQLGETERQIEILSEIMDCFPNQMDHIRRIGLNQYNSLNLKLAKFCLSKVVQSGCRSKEVTEALDTTTMRLAEREHFSNASKKDRPTISACLMVKNEEDCLGKCLESIKDFADEIIVVDTGSSDSTVEIAKRYGARIYHHPWEEDFSKHRNQSMSYARGDWILIIDADETFDQQGAKKMKSLVKKTSKHAILFKVVNCSKKGEVLSLLSAPRLFRNHVGCHYRGIVHNQPHYLGKEEPSSLTVFHHGYDLDAEKMSAKRKRSEELLKRQIEQAPNLVAPIFNMTVSRFTEGDFRGAVANGNRAIELIRKRGITDRAYQGVYYIVSASYFILKAMNKAEAIALEAESRFLENFDTLFVLMMIAKEREDYAGVLKYGKRFLEIHGRICASNADHHFEYRTVGKAWMAMLTMSEACHRCQLQKRARTYFEKACHWAPYDIFPAKERAKFCVSIGEYETAGAYLIAALGQQCALEDRGMKDFRTRC